MFVSQAALEREKEHIADFAPEVRNSLSAIFILCQKLRQSDTPYE